MSSVRNWAVGSAFAALILLSPILALLVVISAQVLVDLLMEVGATALLAIAVGAIGWFLFRKMSPRPKVAPISGDDEKALEEPAIAAPST